MKLSASQKSLIEAIIYTGSIELAIKKIGKKKKTVEATLWAAKQNNNIKSTLHLCLAYLLNYPETLLPDELKPKQESPKIESQPKIDMSKVVFKLEDEITDMDDIIKFKDLKAIYDVA